MGPARPAPSQRYRGLISPTESGSDPEGQTLANRSAKPKAGQGSDPLGLTRSLEVWACAILSATIAASSPTPIRSDDLRLRRKCTPTKYKPCTIVLAQSS